MIQTYQRYVKGDASMARNKYPEETIKLILDVSEKLFLEKGYESTSIQEIINGLGGLSKGAVYHHFKSKEDIFNAVSDRLNEQMVRELEKVRDDDTLSGGQKLKKMFETSLAVSDREIVFSVAPNMLDSPKLLAMQIYETFSDVVPHYVYPVIDQGIRDGSIQTKHPKELSEIIMLLANIWLNPLIIPADNAQMRGRVLFLNEFLKSVGVDLLDNTLLESYERFHRLAREKNTAE